MSRVLLLAAIAVGLLAAAPAHAQFSSAYSEIGDNCTVFAAAEDGEGDWANQVCDGHKGYPVMVQSGDLRESLFYGFPPGGDLAPPFESFAAFNRTGSRIEWRLERRGENDVPFATIHRWYVSDAEDTQRETEVLVVEKVGQPGEQQGCVVGYVVATGNAGANEKARAIADSQAQSFACGADQPAIDSGSVPLPEPTVAQ